VPEFTVTDPNGGRGPVPDQKPEAPAVSPADAAAILLCGIGVLALAVGIGYGLAWWIGLAVFGGCALILGVTLAYSPESEPEETPQPARIVVAEPPRASRR
jgi:hypothetical protein